MRTLTKAAVPAAEAPIRVAADTRRAEAAAHIPARQAAADNLAAADMVPRPENICGHMAPGATPAGTASAARKSSSSALRAATRSNRKRGRS